MTICNSISISNNTCKVQSQKDQRFKVRDHPGSAISLLKAHKRL